MQLAGYRTLPGNSGTAGFTLVELLIVVVIVGILATIAMPRFQNVRERAHLAAVNSDFRQFGVAQEEFRILNDTYAASPDDLEFQGSVGVTLTVGEATASGWSAVGTHAALSSDKGCAIYLGDAAPPDLPDGTTHSTGPGTVQCAR